ncbi:MAG: hypothetical protein R3342_05455 [Lutibacter sp.]|uniref:hypothetical protein n=1 Tax=Lutibacter sp. TaxID=1925666 RepID=UPI00299D7DF5|nr:hypothetical protein [Lutibacter sp.]MDX1828977.1 hypothetical protein [Lutibacter sp.]
MKKLIILLILVSFFSCKKTEIKIPTLPNKGIEKVIYNHSEVWMFFTLNENDTIADINRKNTIATTHWIYNIDKRLPLKTIINSINKLQYKHANSIHSKKGMHDYFSYSDTISKKLSFISFDSISFKTDSLLSKYVIKKSPKKYINFNNINLTFSKNQLLLNDTEIKRSEFKKTLLDFIDFSSDNKITLLHLNFSEDILYADFLNYLTLINNLKTPKIKVDNEMFVFNKTKVPNCNCN